MSHALYRETVRRAGQTPRRRAPSPHTGATSLHQAVARDPGMPSRSRSEVGGLRSQGVPPVRAMPTRPTRTRVVGAPRQRMANRESSDPRPWTLDLGPRTLDSRSFSLELGRLLLDERPIGPREV